MKLLFVAHVIQNGLNTQPGDEIDVTDGEFALDLINRGCALPVKELKVETALGKGSRIKEV